MLVADAQRARGDRKPADSRCDGLFAPTNRAEADGPAEQSCATSGPHSSGAGGALVWARPPWDEPDAPLHFGIVHRDEDLLVVNKPRGLPTMPNGGFRQRRPLPEAAGLRRDLDLAREAGGGPHRGLTLSFTLLDTPPAEADILTDVLAATGVVVTVNMAVVAPSST